MKNSVWKKVLCTVLAVVLVVPKFAGCVDGANWFKSNGKWQNRTYEPKAEDIIFFDWGRRWYNRPRWYRREV